MKYIIQMQYSLSETLATVSDSKNSLFRPGWLQTHSYQTASWVLVLEVCPTRV